MDAANPVTGCTITVVSRDDPKRGLTLLNPGHVYIRIRSFYSPCFLGFVQRLGAGVAG
jgi:hypothetical protein